MSKSVSMLWAATMAEILSAQRPAPTSSLNSFVPLAIFLSSRPQMLHSPSPSLRRAPKNGKNALGAAYALERREFVRASPVMDLPTARTTPDLTRTVGTSCLR
ncbi:hypothetical protein SO694_0002400 [Aureococcus anophagefferens]|uniref:Secreted protein n=1 Tax=Aureococcus anophagefferens TaxID=44056 RepID=A0ABR1FUZ4_AURAN